MQTISVTYVLEWQLKFATHYKITKCGKVFNMRTGRQIKKVLNNRSLGFWIESNFYSLKTLRRNLEKIPKEKYFF